MEDMLILPCICGHEPTLKVTYDTIQAKCENCGLRSETIFGDYYDEGFMHTYSGSVIADWNIRIIKEIKKLYLCPNCNYVLPYYIKVRNGFSKFCPHCGEKLIKEIADEEE